MHITVDVQCNQCTIAYQQIVDLRNGLEFIVAQTICGACGSGDITLGIPVKRVRSYISTRK